MDSLAADLGAKCMKLEEEVIRLRQDVKKETNDHPRAVKHTRYELAVSLDETVSQREHLRGNLRKVTVELDILKAKVKAVEDFAASEINKARESMGLAAHSRQQAAVAESEMKAMRIQVQEAFAQLAVILGASENPSMEELLARAMSFKAKAENPPHISSDLPSTGAL